METGPGNDADKSLKRHSTRSSSKGKELPQSDEGDSSEPDLLSISTTKIATTVEGLSSAMLRRAEWVRQHHNHIGQPGNTPRVGSRVWVEYNNSSRSRNAHMHPATISHVRLGAYNNTVETVTVVYWDGDTRNTHRNLNQVFFRDEIAPGDVLEPNEQFDLVFDDTTEERRFQTFIRLALQDQEHIGDDDMEKAVLHATIEEGLAWEDRLSRAREMRLMAVESARSSNLSGSPVGALSRSPGVSESRLFNEKLPRSSRDGRPFASRSNGASVLRDDMFGLSEADILRLLRSDLSMSSTGGGASGRGGRASGSGAGASGSGAGSSGSGAGASGSGAGASGSGAGASRSGIGASGSGGASGSVGIASGSDGVASRSGGGASGSGGGASGSGRGASGSGGVSGSDGASGNGNDASRRKNGSFPKDSESDAVAARDTQIARDVLLSQSIYADFLPLIDGTVNPYTILGIVSGDSYDEDYNRHHALERHAVLRARFLSRNRGVRGRGVGNSISRISRGSRSPSRGRGSHPRGSRSPSRSCSSHSRSHGMLSPLRGRGASVRGRGASVRGRGASARGRGASLRGRNASLRGRYAERTHML